MSLHQDLKTGIEEGNFRIIARALTFVENDIESSADLLKSLKIKDTLILGITGPPGAGKSTLVNAITNHFNKEGKRIAILAIDPTSPFNFGSLLGDRIRMSQQFNKPNVYIRSVATRGALGGISLKTLEMVDVLKAATFDLIIIETVGVGQSEVEIAGIADKTCVVLVPESGDEIQNIKSGLMEIAQVFVVNKSDRDGADVFANNLKKLMNEQHQNIPVFKTVADKNTGLVELCNWILEEESSTNEKRKFLIADKAYKIIQSQKMKDIDKTRLLNDVKEALLKPDFNVYQFTQNWLKHS
jgi:LAO/AO transport system kinase